MSGPDAIYSLDVDPQVLKSAATELEEQHAIGKLRDLDVIAPGGGGLSRRSLGKRPRICLLCDPPAHECGRSRRHPLPELWKPIGRMVHEAICSLFSDYAYEALLSKLTLTPKAGLVDRRNSGAHRDMCVLVCMPNSHTPGVPCQTMANPIALVGTGFGVHVPALDFSFTAQVCSIIMGEGKSLKCPPNPHGYRLDGAIQCGDYISWQDSQEQARD